MIREGKKETCRILQMRTQDDYILSVCVDTSITDGRCVITGLKNSEEAKKIADLVQGE